MHTLTPSKEHLLKTIKELDPNNCGTRVIDVADKLSISKPSVCNGLNELKEKGYINRTENRKIVLTADGTKIADELISNYRIVSRFFNKVLQIDSKTASTEACALEHVLSESSYRAMVSFLKL